jgi:hypothetical protein
MVTVFIQSQAQALTQGIYDIKNEVVNWGILFAGIGTVSMAILQTARNLLPLRMWFQQSHFRTWINKVSSTAPERFRNTSGASAEKDLINLAAGGDREAFYSQSIDDLCADIKAIASVVMDYPAEHRLLLYCLASEANLQDIEKLIDPPPPEVFQKLPHQHSQEEKLQLKAFAAAKTRVGAQLRCTVDALQTSIAFRWKRMFQAASVLLSAVLGPVVLYLGGFQGGYSARIAAMFIFAVLSGVLAPVARDLVSAIEKMGNP